MLNIGEFARLGQLSPRMLRHYDELGLLKPKAVDPQTGYRHYDVSQLERLHRLLALRDLGFTLEQIRSMLDDDLSVEQLRGMLRLREAQIERDVSEEQARLRRVKAHLHALERSIPMSTLDVTIKTTEPVYVAEASRSVPDFGSDTMNAFWERLYPQVTSHLERAGAKPGLAVAWFEGPDDDGTFVVHIGHDIADQDVPDSDSVRVTQLPPITVASVIHRGPLENLPPVYEALARWIEDSGNQLQPAGASRHLYLQPFEGDRDAMITEVQVPLAS